MEEWMRDIQPGQTLRPKPLWNKTERPPRHLVVPTTIIDTMVKTGCQSGLLLKVEFKNGSKSWLDAGWFCKPNSKYPPGEAWGMED